VVDDQPPWIAPGRLVEFDGRTWCVLTNENFSEGHFLTIYDGKIKARVPISEVILLKTRTL
jgi:hypothetical protein